MKETDEKENRVYDDGDDNLHRECQYFTHMAHTIILALCKLQQLIRQGHIMLTTLIMMEKVQKTLLCNMKRKPTDRSFISGIFFPQHRMHYVHT
jgi:hypothetical protein